MDIFNEFNIIEIYKDEEPKTRINNINNIVEKMLADNINSKKSCD